MQRQIDTLYSDVPEKRNWGYFVADNGSQDGTQDTLLNADRAGQLDVLNLQENIGYGTACNKLASYGDAPLIALLNADVWLTSTDVQKAIQFFEDYPECAVMGPKQRDERDIVRHGGIVGENTRPRHRGWNDYDPEDKAYRDQLECVTVSGSAYFIRRSVWDELSNCPIYRQASPNALGAFLQTQHYYEETWCSYHATAHGYKILYNGDISIGHSFHASHPVGSPMDRLFQVSKSQFVAACDLHGILHD